MSMSRDTKNVKICCIYVDVKGHADMYVCMYSSVSSGTSVFCLEITSVNIVNKYICCASFRRNASSFYR